MLKADLSEPTADEHERDPFQHPQRPVLLGAQREYVGDDLER